MKETLREDNFVLSAALGIPAIGLFGALLKSCYNWYYHTTHSHLIRDETTPLIRPQASEGHSPHIVNINYQNNITTQNNIAINLPQGAGSPTKEELKRNLAVINERLRILEETAKEKEAEAEEQRVKADQRLVDTLQYVLSCDLQNAALVAHIKAKEGENEGKQRAVYFKDAIDKGIKVARDVDLPPLAEAWEEQKKMLGDIYTEYYED